MYIISNEDFEKIQLMINDFLKAPYYVDEPDDIDWNSYYRNIIVDNKTKGKFTMSNKPYGHSKPITVDGLQKAIDIVTKDITKSQGLASEPKWIIQPRVGTQISNQPIAKMKVGDRVRIKDTDEVKNWMGPYSGTDCIIQSINHALQSATIVTWDQILKTCPLDYLESFDDYYDRVQQAITLDNDDGETSNDIDEHFSDTLDSIKYSYGYDDFCEDNEPPAIPTCKHTETYLNKFQTFQFRVCKKCGKDMGDS